MLPVFVAGSAGNCAYFDVGRLTQRIAFARMRR
jgi:hypothetical protein